MVRVQMGDGMTTIFGATGEMKHVSGAVSAALSVWHRDAHLSAAQALDALSNLTWLRI